MTYLFIGLVVASIISQIPHAWYTFNSFSKLTGWLKKLQSAVFCGILSVAIFGFVIIEKPKLALLGAVIEIIINSYYYSIEFWDEGFGKTRYRWRSIATFWRKKWMSMFLGVIIPMAIYLFSHVLVNILK